METQVACKTSDSKFTFTFSNGNNIWAPDTSGEWDEQNSRGHQYCEELLDKIALTKNFGLLKTVIDAMPRGQDQSCGVQVGFFYTLAAAAL